MQGYDESDDSGPELIEPQDLLARDPFPSDARRMGFDRYSDDGAMIALAASLDPAKLSHKIVAWVLLVAITAPVLASLWYEFHRS